LIDKMTYHIVRRVASDAATGTAAVTSTGADAAGLGLLAPVLAFLVVGLIIFALLRKTKIIGGFIFIDALVSVIIAAVFAVNEGVRQLVLGIVPWFAVLVIVLFSILVLMMFISPESVPKRLLVWLFLIVFIIIVIISGIKAFGGEVSAYLPGPFFGVGEDTNIQFLIFFDWLYSARIVGSILLVIAAVVMTWILIAFGD